MKKFLFPIICITFLLSTCKQETKKDDAMDDNNLLPFNDLAENYYQEGLQLNPINATLAGDERFNEQFPNLLDSLEITKQKAYYTKYKEEISKYENSSLSESEQMSKAILEWECNINLETFMFKNFEYFPIDQMWSVNLMMGQLASGAGAQPFKTVEDYHNWMVRVDAYLVWLNKAKENMKEGIKKGYVLPKSLISKVIPQLKEMTESNLAKHLFYAPVLHLPEGFSEENKKDLTQAFTKMITEKVIPAYQDIYTFMNTEYLAAGRNSSGIDSIPNGKAYYQHQIKLHTTTNMTADEIHKLGLSEVARILSEMEKVKNEVGFKGSLKEFFNAVRDDKKLMPYTEPQQIIDHFYAIYETMKPQLNVLFDKKPKTPFEVRQTEAFRENSASAEYNQGSLDGTRPGIFYVPIPDATKYNVYSDESLFLHEAIPGHHYQISLTQENSDLPMFRKTIWYSGYGEGWALYSESLGKELGLYTNPYQYFGMLGAEMHRAIRLVVDTGLHSKGWTREQAIQYSLDNEAESEANIISEIERYMANPGQALSYKIGQLKIKELREESKNQLGDKFDIRKFHNQVLETGCVPLELLENKIDGWIETNMN
jgi:uncharacterized protein (DUF885 family)